MSGMHPYKNGNLLSLIYSDITLSEMSNPYTPHVWNAPIQNW